MPTDSNATIDAVLAGDHARFGDLVRRYDRTVRSIVARHLPRGPAADDVVQETWYRAYRRLAGLSDRSRIEAWLKTIASRCVHDHFRERTRLERFVPLAGSETDTPRDDGLWQTIAGSDPASCELLRWRYREQLSYEEIAARLGVPVSTVRGRLFKARNALRQALMRENR